MNLDTRSIYFDARLISQQQEKRAMNQNKVTLKFVAQNGHAWEEEYDSLEDAMEAVPEVVETHGDIQAVGLLDEEGDLYETIWRFE